MVYVRTLVLIQASRIFMDSMHVYASLTSWLGMCATQEGSRQESLQCVYFVARLQVIAHDWTCTIAANGFIEQVPDDAMVLSSSLMCT